MERPMIYEGNDLNLKATELRLGLPGTTNEPEKQSAPNVKSNKRSSPEIGEESRLKSNSSESDAEICDRETAPPSKEQVVGWPPIRSYRKNNFQPKKTEVAEMAGMYVKVSMDGAPYLRKIDLKVYKSYTELLKALENMFKFSNGRSDYVLTYEDKDGDWMLVGDVPWDMFITSCKRLRIMKGSEARGLGCL